MLERKLEIGTKVDLQIDFINPSTPFKCKGTVVHCEEEKNSFCTGIHFEPLNELKQGFLGGKISEFMAAEQEGQG